jgi:hypothetical protein
MDWLFYGFFGTMFLAGIVGVLWGVLEMVCDIIESNSRKVAVIKISSFIIGFLLAGGGWLAMVTILPFWGVWSIVMLLATPMIGVGMAMYGLS